MEGESQAAAAAAAVAAAAEAAGCGPLRRWAADVIVLNPGPAKPKPPRSEDAVVVAGAGAAAGQAQHVDDTPPEKLYFKTRLCDKYENTGRCMYLDGCTFAHGRAELRPPVPPPALTWRRSPDGGYVGGKVCHNFRDKGTCHFGDRCAFPHAAAPALPPGHAIHITGDQKPPVDEGWSATPPGRPAPAPRPARTFMPVPGPAKRDRPDQKTPEENGGKKPNRLMLMSLRKTSGIYGDWPEDL